MILDNLASLKPLETFNKNTFLGDKEYSQDFCNFILALSLIWNDLKFISSYHDYILESNPQIYQHKKDSDMPITPYWGEVCGILVYLEKMLVALIHELFSLIKYSKNVINSKCFKSIYKKLHKDNRKSWDIIIKYTFDKTDTSSELGKAFMMVRHKIANHYDKGEIFKGYKLKFLNTDMIPYISRGTNMKETRYYFADASAQEYYKVHQEKVTTDIFLKNLSLLQKGINSAIHNIVETFIQQRSSWRPVKLNS